MKTICKDGKIMNKRLVQTYRQTYYHNGRQILRVCKMRCKNYKIIYSLWISGHPVCSPMFTNFHPSIESVRLFVGGISWQPCLSMEKENRLRKFYKRISFESIRVYHSFSERSSACAFESEEKSCSIILCGIFLG